MKNRTNQWLVGGLVASLLASVQPAAATVYLVSTSGSASDSNSGTGSWSNAFRTVKKARDTAGIGDQVWVAAGTYYPPEGTGNTADQSVNFQLKSDVKIFGGLAGTENPATFDPENAPRTSQSILSGDLNTNGVHDSPDSLTVVKATSVNDQRRRVGTAHLSLGIQSDDAMSYIASIRTAPNWAEKQDWRSSNIDDLSVAQWERWAVPNL